MSFDKLYNQLGAMPLARLEAIYNAAARNTSNPTHRVVMAAIELIVTRRGGVIEGAIGTYEFVKAE